jgi:hypothetical protein
MSWWVALKQGENVCQVAPFSEGGTQVLGGSTNASLNITYNYGRLFRLALHPEGLVALHEQRAGTMITLLHVAVTKLGDRPYEADYWADTCGNAGHALAILLKWARQYPDAIFEVS